MRDTIVKKGQSLMFVGKAPVDSIFLEMHKSEIEFELTGSHFFGNYKPNSDWDFFVEDSFSTREWLTSHGFNLLSEAYENDPQITAIFRYGNVEEGEFPQVDVQLTLNVEKKRKVQEILKANHLIFGMTSKKFARQLWKSMYEAME